jgi:hypothetical protein
MFAAGSIGGFFGVPMMRRETPLLGSSNFGFLN